MTSRLSQAATLLLCFAAAACAGGGGGGGGGQALAPTPVSPPPPPAPSSFTTITGQTALSGPQGGVVISAGTSNMGVTQSDSATSQVSYDPNPNAATPFSVTANLNGTSTSRAFTQAERQATVNPLTTGTNPRATGTQIFGGQTSSSRVDIVQAFELRRAAGAPPFNYARLLQYAYVSNAGLGSSFSDYIVYGFPTPAANMPSSGTATWTGVGTGSYSSIGAATSYDFLGNASVDVNFGARTLAGTINNMSYTNGTTLITPANLINSVQLTGTITGSTFSGTAFTTFTVALGISAPMRGQFYGPSNGAPVEAGGSFAGSSPGGNIFGGFVVGAP